ncbi:MAG: chromosome partitioning protein ParB, partial [Comamonadaceae bacterium]
MATKKPKGLGRGLEALLGPTAMARDDDQDEHGGTPNPTQLRLSQMVAGMYQPRTRMDEGALY